MMRRTPMRRTGWARKPVDSHLHAKKPEENQPLALMQPAPVAIKAVAKCRAVMAKIGDVVDVACPKAPKPWRNRAYRELVASLECYHCRAHGHSQCAHANTGKGKGLKTSDEFCFPMCTVGGKDCHGQFDQYKLVPRAAMQAYEEAAHRWTVATLHARGMWPASMPKPIYQPEEENHEQYNFSI